MLWGQMKRITSILFLALGIGLIFTPIQSASAQTGRNPDEERAIYEQLAQINPDAVEPFQAATKLMDAGDYTAARTGYARVLDLVPDFPPALRRISFCEMELGNFKEAETHAVRALELEPSPENQAGLALVWMSSTDHNKQVRALELVQQASRNAPSDPFYPSLAIFFASQLENDQALQEATRQLLAIEPNNPLGHFAQGILHLEDKQWEKAEAELLQAKALGYPSEDVDSVLNDEGVRFQVMLWRNLKRAGVFFSFWLAGILLLGGLGALLSRITLGVVNRQITTADFNTNSFERLLRSLYRLVIGLASFYFYFSIPVVIALVLALAGGGIYLILAYLDFIPLKLVLGMAIVALISVFALVKGLFARMRDQVPGPEASRDEYPQLWQFVNDVAEKMKARPVDRIYLTPLAEVAVTEKGELLQRLSNRGMRELILGLGALNGLSQGQLRSILAHEYAHFSNRDTAGGRMAGQVVYSMQTIGGGIVNGGGGDLNPAMWFIRAYYQIFLRLTLGASRLQEILADRAAVLAYGAHTAVGGLKTIIRRALEFSAQINLEVPKALEENRQLRNLYALEPLGGTASLELEKSYNEALSRPSSPFDSHPAPKDRIALMQRIYTGIVSSEDTRPAWDLFPNPSEVQEKITALIQIR
jgi:Zn-dependent protease with chaperone function